MKKPYIIPKTSVINIETSVLMLSGGDNASFKPGSKDEEYEGDFKSSRFEWSMNDED